MVNCEWNVLHVGYEQTESIYLNSERFCIWYAYKSQFYYVYETDWNFSYAMLIHEGQAFLLLALKVEAEMRPLNKH